MLWIQSTFPILTLQWSGKHFLSFNYDIIVIHECASSKYYLKYHYKKVSFGCGHWPQLKGRFSATI